MTHDPDHDQRAMNPDPNGSSGLHDERLQQAYRDARRGPQGDAPWELRGARHAPSGPNRPGPSTTTRVLIAVILVIALVATLIGRW